MPVDDSAGQSSLGDPDQGDSNRATSDPSTSDHGTSDNGTSGRMRQEIRRWASGLVLPRRAMASMVRPLVGFG